MATDGAPGYVANFGSVLDDRLDRLAIETVIVICAMVLNDRSSVPSDVGQAHRECVDSDLRCYRGQGARLFTQNGRRAGIGGTWEGPACAMC